MSKSFLSLSLSFPFHVVFIYLLLLIFFFIALVFAVGLLLVCCCRCCRRRSVALFLLSLLLLLLRLCSSSPPHLAVVSLSLAFPSHRFVLLLTLTLVLLPSHRFSIVHPTPSLVPAKRCMYVHRPLLYHMCPLCPGQTRQPSRLH